MIEELYRRIDHALESGRGGLSALSLKIHANPELRFEEHNASSWLAKEAGAVADRVEHPVGGLATAFRATRGRGAHRVAFLAEYDALFSGDDSVLG